MRTPDSADALADFLHLTENTDTAPPLAMQQFLADLLDIGLGIKPAPEHAKIPEPAQVPFFVAGPATLQ